MSANLDVASHIITQTSYTIESFDTTTCPASVLSPAKKALENLRLSFSYFHKSINSFKTEKEAELASITSQRKTLEAMQETLEKTETKFEEDIIILNKTIQTFERSPQLKKAALEAIANIKVAIACSKKEIQKIKATIASKEERVSGIDRLMKATASQCEKLISEQAKQITTSINTALKKHFKSNARKTVFKQQQQLHSVANYSSFHTFINEQQAKVESKLGFIENTWKKLNKVGVTEENLKHFVALNQTKLELTKIAEALGILLEDSYLVSGENNALIVETSNKMFEDIESEDGSYLSVLETAKVMSEVDSAKEAFDSKCQALYLKSEKVIVDKTKLLNSRATTLAERAHKLAIDLDAAIGLEDVAIKV